MQALLRAVTPCEVEVGGRLYLVRRPTVHEAFAVLVATTDATAWPALERLLPDWLGDLAPVVQDDSFGRNRAIEICLSILRYGLPEPAQSDQTAKRAADAGGAFLVALYGRFFGISPSVVLGECWQTFVLMLGEMDRIRAQEQADSIGWYVSAKNGRADSIFHRARGGVFTGYEMPDEMRDPEWLARQQEVINRRRWRTPVAEA